MPPRSRVVKPETRRLDISGDDWLLVKRRLNTGEQRKQFARIYRDNNGASRLTVDPLQTGVALVLSYLLDWSLVDESGQVIPIRDADDATKLAALDAIDYDSFVEIKKAIEAHQAENDADTAAKKTTDSGEPTSPATSRSPDDAAGNTTGSVS